MTETPRSYPLKLLSRSLPSSRANKIRISWFVVGMSFGIGCTVSLTPLAMSMQPQIAAAPEIPAPVAVIKPSFPDAADLASMVALSPSPSIAELEPEQEQETAQNDGDDEVTRAISRIVNGEDDPRPNSDSQAPPDANAVAALEPSSGQAGLFITGKDPLNMTLSVAEGDTLSSLIASTGIAENEADELMQAVRKHYDPKSLGAGQEIAVKLARSAEGTPMIDRITLPMPPAATLEVTREESGAFAARRIDAPVEKKLARAGGQIRGSLYETAQSAGLPKSMIGEMIAALSYDVDFQRDVQAGDMLDVLYERTETKDGRVTGYGKMIYAELDLGSRAVKIYRYTDKSGRTDYYNARGESVRKALLRTPISGARVTSRFGMRNHPIMGYSKMHRGVDFGAPSGTPIYAAGDGTVQFAGRKGGYGNYLLLQHNNTYATAYGHVSRFARGITPGSKVRQGQVIAYVGSTGMSTGPHLHYEILANGNQVNPSGVKFKTGNVLSGNELASFRASISRIEAMVNATKPAKVAMATMPDGLARVSQ